MCRSFRRRLRWAVEAQSCSDHELYRSLCPGAHCGCDRSPGVGGANVGLGCQIGGDFPSDYLTVTVNLPAPVVQPTAPLEPTAYETPVANLANRTWVTYSSDNNHGTAVPVRVLMSRCLWKLCVGVLSRSVAEGTVFSYPLISLWIVEHAMTGEITRPGGGVQIQSANIVWAHDVLVEIDEMCVVDACPALDPVR